MKQVDCVYFDAGGGHRSTLQALQAVLETQHRSWELRPLQFQDALLPIDVMYRSTGVRVEEFYNRILRSGWTLGAAILVLAAVLPLPGQTAPAAPRAAAQYDPLKVLVLHYTVKELDGRTVQNSRSYELRLTNQDNGRIRIGNRVPIPTVSDKGGSHVEYMPTGLTINSAAHSFDNRITLRTDIELSSLVPTDNRKGGLDTPPIIRNLEFHSSTLIQPGQLVRLGTVDDIATHRRFEFDVLAEVPAQ